MSWLHVRMAGFGRRASMEMRGGTLPGVGIGDWGMLFEELLRSNRPGFLLDATLSAFSMNWCCRRAYASPSVFSGRGGSIGSSVKIAMALGFSLKNCGLFTVTLTKYLISASPGKPASDGGSVLLMWCVAGRAISGRAFENETLGMGLFDCWHFVFRGT